MNSSYQFTPHILLMLASAVFTTMLLVYVWRRRSVPGATPFAVFLFCVTLVVIGDVLIEDAVDLPTKIFWFKVIGVWPCPYVTAQLWFALEYANLRRWLTRRTLALFAIPPLLFLFLIITNDAHHLMWVGFTFDGYLRASRGLGNWMGVGYGYLLMIAATLVVIWLFTQSPLHRVPITFVLCGLLAVTVVYLLNLMNINPVAPMNLGVLTLTFSSVMYALALFRFRMFDFLPVARATVISQMREGMLVLDAQHRIVDLNLAAEKILSVSAKSARGQPMTRFLPHPSLNMEHGAPKGIPSEISIGTSNLARYYTWHHSPLMDQRGASLGYLILLRDITEQKQAQHQLLEQQRVVATLQEREHLARELHDGLAQMLAATHLQASTAKRLLAQGANAQMSECLDRLTEMTLEMESDVREHLLGAKTIISGDQCFFAALREYLVRFCQQYDLHIELSVPPELEAQGLSRAVEAQLLRIIQEALSNIRKHAHAHCAWVDFVLTGQQARIVIADDGKGFDPDALAAQAKGFGLQSMCERAQEVGGSLEVISRAGQGTQVIVQVPLNGELKT